MKKTAVGGFIAYYRVSTDQQGASGLGLEAQRSSVSRYLAGAGQLTAEFTEIESGKSHLNRPQLKLAIEACKRQRAKLIIAKLDRLARNVHFISGLMESGVEFCAVDMPSANKLTIHIMAAMAEHEREMISARTKAALDAARQEISERGFRISRRSGREYSKHGNPRWEESLGKARVARKLQPLSEQMVEMIRGLRVQGKTFREIVLQLNGLGLTTPNGAKWYASTVRGALLKAPTGGPPSVPDTLAA